MPLFFCLIYHETTLTCSSSRQLLAYYRWENIHSNPKHQFFTRFSSKTPHFKLGKCKKALINKGFLEGVEVDK